MRKIYKVLRERENLEKLLKRVLSSENLYYKEKKTERVKELVALFLDLIKNASIQTKHDKMALKKIVMQ